MAISQTEIPPYELSDVPDVKALPFHERTRLIGRMWASQQNATPFSVIVMYWLKYLLLFAGGWAFFNSFSSTYTSLLDVGSWAFTPVAFQKALVWAMFYECLGLGCSSGPMNARFWPPIGGVLHFLRPGTTKLALYPKLPVLGGSTRSVFDVVLYTVHMLFLLRALLSPAITPDLLIPTCIILPILGVADKTIFLAARSEHYLIGIICMAGAFAGGVWIAACQVLWCCIWFWAATSKLNHHFPSVIMVMMNNGPFFPSFLKNRLFVNFPDDLRPSKFAAFMAHMGTATEYSIPFILLLSDSTMLTGGMLFVAFSFHGFIALNNPSGMPIEWNILMVYGAIFLFGFNPEVSVLSVAEVPWLAALMFCSLILLPLYGNLVPSRVSFLLAMRYYAGNWAYNIWFFRGDSAKKLNKLKKAAGTMREQLEGMIDDPLAVETVMMSTPATRLAHLQGKALFDAIPHAMDDVDEYEWMEGEIVAGLALGWNFGDGHLNEARLLEVIQEQCGFEEGELRVVMVESQPLFGRAMHWKAVDAVTGVLAEGDALIEKMRKEQPWPTGDSARPFMDAVARKSAG